MGWGWDEGRKNEFAGVFELWLSANGNSFWCPFQLPYIIFYYAILNNLFSASGITILLPVFMATELLGFLFQRQSSIPVSETSDSSFCVVIPASWISKISEKPNMDMVESRMNGSSEIPALFILPVPSQLTSILGGG